MPPIPISLGLKSSKGRLGVDSAVQTVNMDAEPLEDGSKHEYAVYPAPGLVLLHALGAGPFRGALSTAQGLYVCAGRTLYLIRPTGGVVVIGGVPGDGIVTIEQNSLADPDIVVVGGGSVFVQNSKGYSRLVTDAMPAPISVAFVGGRFLFGVADGRFFYTRVNSTEIDGDAFYNAEGKPDGLIRAYVRRREVWLFGTLTLEVWSITGDELDPFTPLGGGARPYGCLSAAAVAEIDDRIFWIDQDYAVRMAQGYDGTPISTAYVTRVIKAEPDKTGITASVSTVDDTDFYEISGSTFTLRYNLKTGRWTDRVTGQLARWVGHGSVRDGDDTIVGDYRSGNLYRVDKAATSDGDEPIYCRLVSPCISAFPSPVVIYSLHVDVEPRALAVEPKMQLRMSYDGGKSFQGSIAKKIGKVGGRNRAIWRKLGPVERQGAYIELSGFASDIGAVMAVVINGDTGVG